MSEMRAFAELVKLKLEEIPTNLTWLADRIGADKGQVSRWLKPTHSISYSYKKQIIRELNLEDDPRLEAVKDPSTWNPWWKLEVSKADFKSQSSQEQDALIRNYLRGAQPALQVVRDGMVQLTKQVELLLSSIEAGNAITVLTAPIGEGVTSTLLQCLEVLTRIRGSVSVYWCPDGRLPTAPPPEGGKAIVVADRPFNRPSFPTWCREIDPSNALEPRLILGCREKDRRWLEKKLATEIYPIPLAGTALEDAPKYVRLIKEYRAFDNPDVDLESLFTDEVKGASGYGLLPAMIAATRGEALYMRYKRLVESYEPNSYAFHTLACAVWLSDINDRIAHGRLPKIAELTAHVGHHTKVLGLTTDNSEFEVDKFFGRMMGEVAQVGLGSYEFRHPKISKLLFREIFGTSANKSRPEGTFRASKWTHYATFAKVGPHRQGSINPPKITTLAANLVYLIGYDRAHNILHESPAAIEEVVRYTINELFGGQGNDVKSDYYKYLSRGLAQLSKHYNSENPKAIRLHSDTIALMEASIEEDRSPASLIYHANTLRGLPAKVRVSLDGENKSWFDLCDEARKSALPEDVERLSVDTLRVRLRGTPNTRPNSWQHYPVSAFEHLIENCARANFPISSAFKSDRLVLLCNLSSWSFSGYVGSTGERVDVPDGDYIEHDLRTIKSILFQVWREIARVRSHIVANQGAPPTSLKSRVEAVFVRWLRIEQDNPSNHLTSWQREALIKALTDQDLISLADALPQVSQ